MSAKVSANSVEKSKSSGNIKKIIKPMNPQEFNPDNVKYSKVKVNTEYKTRWCDITYNRDNNDEKMLVVARNCVIKTFGLKKDINNKKDDDESSNVVSKEDNKGKKNNIKYQMFINIVDQNFIEFIKKFEESLCIAGADNSKEWFEGEEFNVEECQEMLKSCLIYNEKYKSYAIGCSLSSEFTCKSKTDKVPDVSDLLTAITKNTVADICFNPRKIPLGKGTFKIAIDVLQCNITDVLDVEYISNAITIEEYQPGNIALSQLETNTDGGKFCKFTYDNNTFRFKLENVVGRIFKFDNEDKGKIKSTYSMSIRMTNPELLKFIEGVNKEIFDILLDKSKDYYGTKKNSKILKNIVKSLVSYNKADQEKIAKGEKPTYCPSVWIKLFHNDEKGFDGKITTGDNKPITNTDDILNKDLNINNIEIYSRHIWFGPKGTSINLTMNKCSIVYETTEYDMDDATGNDEEDADEEEVVEEEAGEEEVVNSDTNE